MLEAAATVVVERGYREARMEDVADRLGILKGSLYYYVKSKEDLLYELVLRANRSGMEVLASLDDIEGTGLQKLEVFIERWVAHVEQHHHLGLIFQREVQQLSSKRLDKVRRERHLMEERTQGIIELGVRDGSLSSATDPDLATKALFVVLNSSHAWTRRRSRAAGDTAARITQLLIEGLRSREDA